MSDMAAEMAARMEADGLSPSTDRITPGAAADPGTGQVAAPPQTPPAEALTPDTSADGQEPGPIPYSRFKEVNDELAALRPYRTLYDYGYDADSLSRLANFEANYVQDPGATVMALVDNLDLPDDSKTVIRDLLVADDDQSPAGAGTPSTPAAGSDEPPAWFKPYADRVAQEDQARFEARETQMREAALNEVLQHWSEADTAAGITKPAREGVKLALISTAAASGAYPDTESLAKAARAEWIAEREEAVGSHFVPPGMQTGPRSVPGSAAAASPPQKFRNLGEVNKAVAAAIERGELPRPGV